jgi:hypothetical protein
MIEDHDNTNIQEAMILTLAAFVLGMGIRRVLEAILLQSSDEAQHINKTAMDICYNLYCVLPQLPDWAICV